MKVVIWDWNGTIVNDAPLHWGIFNQLIEEHGRPPVDFDHYREIYTHPVRDMYHAAGVEVDAAGFARIAQRWQEIYETSGASAELHHDVVETLDRLAQAGARQAVLSALPHEILLQSVRYYGLDRHFEAVAGLPDSLGRSKVEAGRTLVRELRVDPSHSLIVGDSSHDAEVARELGANCVLVARGLESRRKLERHGFPVLDSFADLIAIRDSL